MPRGQGLRFRSSGSGFKVSHHRVQGYSGVVASGLVVQDVGFRV